jgi:hypothetical protein
LGLGDLALGHAHGGAITIYDSNGSAWTASWSNNLNPGLTLGPALPGPNQTKDLTLTYTFKNTVPIEITFKEAGVATKSYGGSNVSGPAGLNFVLTEQMTNGTPASTFTRITESLEDSDLMLKAGKLVPATVPASEGDDHHPSFSHFHKVTGDYTPLKDITQYMDPKNAKWSQTVVLGDGKLAPNNVENYKVRIHDIVVKDYERQFTLTIAATNPEPTSVIMLSIGMMTLVGYTVRSKYRARRNVRT